MGSSDDAWRRWGEIDPYFAVLTAPEFHSNKMERSKDEFFASGVAHVDGVVRRIRQYFPDARFESALDFGCGVGRLTIPLGSHYSEVIGVDISPAMLEEARANAARMQLGNVQFALSDDALSAAAGPLDLVHTFIVLQHIPVKRGLDYVARMVSLLRPGGVVSLHFTVDRQGNHLRDRVHWARSNIPLFNNLVNVARRRSWNYPMMQMNEYPLVAVLKLLEANGVETQVLSLDHQTTTVAVQLLAQKVR